jgi:D-3-phosphoglycerate dehydrogenase
MNFLLLEKYPFIDIKYLDYLISRGHNIIKNWDVYDYNSIDATISNIKIIDSAVLNQFPNLKYVCRTWVWLDMIDLEAAKIRWIKVINTPLANFSSVSDIAIWGIIWLLRKTYLDFKTLDDGFKFFGRELSEVKVWILWFWNIWREIYFKLKWFWVNSFEIYDPFCDKETIEQNEKCKKINSNKNIYKNCNVIIFTLPLFPETKHILWWKDFNLLKNDTILVNISRWWILDEDWLVKFLKENPESWAYLDVREDEPNAPRKDLKELINCIITPHIWAMTNKAYKNMHYFKELDKN